MSIAQLVVGPHSSSTLIRSDSTFTVDTINLTTLNMSGDFNLTSGNSYQINSVDVLSENTLGVGVIQSSLETVGTLTSLNVVGDTSIDGDTIIDGDTSITGELGITGDTSITGDVLIEGDLTVVGTTTSTSTVNITVTAPMFKLASTNPADSVDIGVYGQYVEGGVTKYQGYYRDQTDNTFKFFTGTTHEPAVFIDSSPDTGFTLGDLSIKNLSCEGIYISTTGYMKDLEVTNNASILGDLNTGDINTTGDINISETYKINGNDVLSENTLGVGITQSSLETVGTLTSLNISGDLTIDTDTLYVQSTSDRVGINTTAPAFNLDVNGIINAENSYYVDGQQVLTQNGLNAGVTSSSLETVGTLESLTISGDLSVDTNTFYIDSTTNFIGIGTIAPEKNLHIIDNNTLEQQMLIQNTNVSGKAGLEFVNTGATFAISMDTNTAEITNNGGNIVYKSRDTGQHRFTTTDSDTLQMIITNSGNVAIGGHNSPSYLLDVSDGDINTNFGVYRVNGTEVLSETTLSSSVVNIGPINSLIVNDDLTVDDVLFVDVSENKVGINNSAPAYDLDVTGDINFTGQIYQDGAILVNPDGIWTQQGSSAYLTLGGDVAIGTSNPSVRLHLSEDFSSGSNSSHTIMRIDSNSTINIQNGFGSAISFRAQRHSIGATYDEIRQGGLIENVVYSGAGSESDEWQFNIKAKDSTGLNNIMSMRGNGNVGIGTETPNTLLEIADENPQLRITDTRTSSGGAADIELGSIGFYNDDISGVGPTLHARISTLTDSTSVKPIGKINFETYINGVPRTVLTCSGVSGFAGIGTETPNTLLEIADENPQLRITDTRISSGGVAGEELGSIGFYNNDVSGVGPSLHARILTTTDTTSVEPIGRLNLQTYIDGSPTTVLTCSGENGYVGIGTVTPSHVLDIVGTDIKLDSNSTDSASLRLDTTGGSGRVITRTNAADVYIGDVDANGGECIFRTNGIDVGRFDTAGKLSVQGSFSPQISLAVGDDDTGWNWVSAGILEQVMNNTSVRRMNIDRSMGCYGSGANVTSVQRYRKESTAASNNVFVDFYRSATNTTNGTHEGDIRLNGSGNLAFQNASDIRLKDNIVDYTNGYNKVKSLRTVEYEWKNVTKKEIGRIVGFIAQEVKEEIPKAVGAFDLNGEEYYGISQSEMIPFNWSATRTLIDKVETLEKENTILKKQMTTILTRLYALENNQK